MSAKHRLPIPLPVTSDDNIQTERLIRMATNRTSAKNLQIQTIQSNTALS